MKTMRCLCHSRSARRGVLLLVVLSLLVLMSMIALAFVMMTGQARRIALSQSRAERAAITDPAQQLDAAFLQVVRGTNNPNSVLGPHSLLEDMYGDKTIELPVPPANVKFVGPSATPGGLTQLIDLVVNDPAYVANLQSRDKDADGYFNGCVLTLRSTDGVHSTRIVGYHAEAGARTFRVLPVDNISSLAQLSGTAYVNGRPFTGFGFCQQLPQSGDSSLDVFSLLPNFRPAPTANGANEDYDAPDPQNMLLAYLPATAANSADIIPSLHRPELVNYWYHKLYDGNLPPPFNAPPYGIDWTGFKPMQKWTAILNPATLPAAKDQTRKTIIAVKLATTLRPLHDLHPAFNGSNPRSIPTGTPPVDLATGELQQLWELNGPWDVDNDGDGVPDSIWVDLGLPVQAGPDGRLYKPLFAVLCVDMDGRLNVNAHGSLAQAEQSFYQPLQVKPPLYRNHDFSPAVAGAGMSQPRGLGYGTADIGLAALFPNPDSALAGTRRLLIGNVVGGVKWEGRYGEFSLNVIGSTMPPSPGDTSSPLPGRLSMMKDLEAVAWTGNRLNSTAYAAPTDPNGSGTVLLDKRGQPLNLGMIPDAKKADGTPQRVPTPYEMDLSRRAVRATRATDGVDNAFTAAELEHVLRPFDADTAVLPERLQKLLSATGMPSQQLLQISRRVTTDSFDLPSPAFLTNRDLRKSDPASAHNPMADANRHIVDLIDAYLRKSVPAAQLADQRKKLIAPELMAGLKLDINRPLGNGGDADGDGVVDGPNEEGAKAVPPGVYGAAAVPLDLTNGFTPPDPTIRARQLLARHLYVLAMLLKPEKAQIEYDGNLATSSDQETAYALAQWAINVVDFRDRDSVMTPFVFDIHPLDGWDVSNPADRGLVWGCERPELLITETLAFHDRRTENLGSGKSKHDPTDPTTDPDYDQRLRPQGSLFVELYNPWTGLDEMPSGEFSYDRSWRSGVVLNKRNAAGDPVWRMLVVGNQSKDADPDDNLNPANRTRAADIERSIYFAGAPVKAYGAQGQAYYGDAAKLSPIPPGRYAVIGPAAQTMIGRHKDVKPQPPEDPTNEGPLYYEKTRRIELTPSKNADVKGVQVFNNNDPTDPPAGGFPPAVAIVINKPERLSISEPTGLDANDPPYVTAGDPTWDPAAAGGEGAWTDPENKKPKDAERGTKLPAWFGGLAQNGTIPKFRTLHLQRLADPAQPWDAVTNPYLTIDSAYVDLTCFNGVTVDDKDPQANSTDNTNGVISNQRGELKQSLGTNNVWFHEPERAVIDQPKCAPDSTHYLEFTLYHSLGYLNRPYWAAPPAPPYLTNASAPADPRDSMTKLYAGAPSELPFPWLTWNNRPYVSPHELLLVPRSRSSRLLFDVQTMFTTPRPGLYNSPLGLFSHLLNLYQADVPAGVPPGTEAPALYRIFDYLRVRSHWVGTESMLNPTMVRNLPLDEWDYWSSLHAPFNWVSNYRDPGAVNINTVNDNDVWESIFHGNSYRHPGPPFAQLVASRRGYGDKVDGNQFTLKGSANKFVPSRFSNPFRSSAGSQLTLFDTPSRRDIDVTLMRTSDPEAKANSPAGPLFGTPPSGDLANDPSRNPYFAFQSLRRNSNLLTTRSNVYAVWITVGRFEALPVPGGASPVYPDGYMLGPELGSETGEIVRHRAFYMLDRTIPVGFARGQDLNVEKAVLVKRFIE